MRFHADGPDIPDELLNLRDEGRVVFFCGAGVSMGGAGLPSFNGLAQLVLNGLGQSEGSEEHRLLAAMNQLESEGLGGAISADRVFSKLERNFGKERVAQAVSEALMPDAGANLSAHRTILRLSASGNDGARLITTNFDRLFERCDPTVSSHTRSTLPRVSLGDTNWGIVHLHGRVSESQNGPDADGFVLSSSEFGDAYLSNGWAREFVREVLDAYAAVFIGYTADDPPMRYLLEGLKKSDGQSARLFAFQSGPEDEAIAKWDDKGVIPIAYDVDPGDHSHRKLYASLDAWAYRAKSPTRWRDKVLARFRNSPANLEPHERGMVAHLVKTRRGAVAFRNQKPPMSPEWLCVFDPKVRYAGAAAKYGGYESTPVVDPFTLYSLDSDELPAEENEEFVQRSRIPSDAWDALALNAEDRFSLKTDNYASFRFPPVRGQPGLPPRLSALADWIGSVAHHPAAVWWAAKQPYLHPEIIDRIRYTLDRKPRSMRNAVQRAWLQLLEVFRRSRQKAFNVELYQAREALKASDWASSVIREFAEINRVGLKREYFGARPVPPNWSEAVKLSDLIDVRVYYPEHRSELEVPDHALGSLVSALTPCVEEAIDLSTETRDLLRVTTLTPYGIEDEDRDFERSYHISGYVLWYAELFRKLIRVDPSIARAEYLTWRRSDPIFRRLRYWAAGHPQVASASEFAEELIALPTKDFWGHEARRDLMLPLASRWADIPTPLRTQIEGRLLAGPSDGGG